MQWTKILTPLLAASVLAAFAPAVQAQHSADDTLLQMQQAFRKGERKRLSELLPATRGHPLEPWAAYWELRARLDEAQPDEVQAFLTRWAGTYQEDRLRNDWLLLLGQRRDWARFAELHPHYRMGDDSEVRCYAMYVDSLQQPPQGAQAAALADEVRRLWYGQRDGGDGCSHMADRLLDAGHFKPADIWRKARLAMEANRARAVREAVALLPGNLLPELAQLQSSPTKYLTGRSKTQGTPHRELVVLALTKLATSDHEAAARLLQDKWAAQLSAEERDWVWGVIGKRSAQRLESDALDYFAKVGKLHDLNDDQLAWKARAALRAGQWSQVRKAIDAMSPTARADSTWVYWSARALLAGRPSAAQQQQARELFESIASERGFYEQLALEELGRSVTVPPAPPALSDSEKAAARTNPGLNRGLYAIVLGLRAEGVREWNYTTNLHQPGGMTDRELLAAADFACAQQVWDRCINTSERTRSVVDMAQRYPTPYRTAVLQRTREIGLDAAYVYGLIRQESRFIMDARSGVGASGLMQVMPATARWTAKKIGLTDFSPEQINDRDTNITIGTAYLKLALDDFDGSMALAAAAYNAGPGRPRNWRNGPLLEAAIWAENVPFTETRDYVKKVLANTTNYAAVLTGQPQSLRSRLGTVGPRTVAQAEPNADLP